MKMAKGILMAAFGMIGFIACAQAQDYTAPETAQTAPPPPSSEPYWRGDLYHPCELSLDGSFVGALHEYDFNNGGLHRKNYRFGGDVGANFFFTRYIGVGGDAMALAGYHPSFVDTVMGDLILRMPIGNTGLAPYIFGGAGYEFERVDQLVGGGGVGLEFRPVPHFGFFVDARYLAAVKTADYGIGRAGVRISF